MSDQIVEVAEGFWNIRGTFKVAGLLDVGTQASLVRRQDGSFVMLDSYACQGEAQEHLLALTDQGRAVRAILNLHPFHTVHVAACAARFPEARLYGTTRHLRMAKDLPWQPLVTESPEFQAEYGEEFTFTVPRGVDFTSDNDLLHFASVLALHKPSRTLHVDDTLSWLGVPLLGGLKFHPTLRFVLQKRKGAAADFRSWAQELIGLCEGVDHLCTAHGRELPPADLSGGALVERVTEALSAVEGVLSAHERRYG